MVNIVALTGRLTYEPELKSTPAGVSVIRIQVACDRNYQAQGQERQADFIDCVAWRNTAEFISRNFHKGDMVGIEGSIETSNYTDKDGNKRKQVEVKINNVSFCGSVNRGGQNAQQGYNNSPASSYAGADDSDFEEIVVDDDDDLPF